MRSVLALPLALPLALAVGCAEVEPGRQVYLDFSDGSHGVALGDEDDASADVSQLCAAEAFAPFAAPAGCGGGDLDRCQEEILAALEDRFAAFDIGFSLSRPEEGPYAKIVIAPPDPGCAFGQRGVAFEDCGDQNPASVGFAFDCYAGPAACAVLIAHEVAHGLGLVHSQDPTDILVPAPGEPSLRFRREESGVGENSCGITRQSSHRALLEVLGAAG